jgi:hypothetical protein
MECNVTMPTEKKFVLFDKVVPKDVFDGARRAGQWGGHCGGGTNMEESKRANLLVDECMKDPMCFSLLYFRSSFSSMPERVEHYFCKHHYIVARGNSEQDKRYTIFAHPLSHETLFAMKCFQVPEGGQFTFGFYEKHPEYFPSSVQLVTERIAFEKEKRDFMEEKAAFEKQCLYHKEVVDAFRKDLTELYP